MVCVVLRSAIPALAGHVNICNQSESVVFAKICPINLTFKSLSEPMFSAKFSVEELQFATHVGFN
jgi:hypothetical protein